MIWRYGTIRENRLPMSCPLSETSWKKGKRLFRKRYYGILVAKWFDNSVVCFATNQYGINPVANVRRYSQKEKKIHTS